MDERGIAPVIGGILVVSLTVLLASMFSVEVTEVADFASEGDQIDDLVNGSATPTPDVAEDSDDGADSDDEDGSEDDDDDDDDDDD